MLRTGLDGGTAQGEHQTSNCLGSQCRLGDLLSTILCEPDQVEIGMAVVVDFQDVDAGERGEAGVALAVPRFRPA